MERDEIVEEQTAPVEMVTIIAFDRKFPLPRARLAESKILVTGLSGRFSEQNTINLELEDQFYPAFLIIYDYLLNPEEEIPSISLEMLGQVLALADYLDMEFLISRLFERLLTRSYTLSEILPLLLEFQHLPGSVDVAKVYFAKRGYYWDKLSTKTQRLLEPYFDQDFTKEIFPPLALRPVPIIPDTRKLFPMMPQGWAKGCQKGNRPEIISDINLLPDLIARRKKIDLIFDEQGRGHYITCPGNKQLTFKLIHGNNLPCCETTSNLSSLDPRWARLKPVMTDQGWVALVDPTVKGDFILIWRPQLVRELRLIVDLSAL